MLGARSGFRTRAPLIPTHRRTAAKIEDFSETETNSMGGLVMMQSSEAPQSAVVLRVFLLVAVATIFARAFHFTVEPLAWVARADNDDMMRLLSVRGWLEGQDWFDMRQYRMVPPEGLDLHWSRYIDAAIAGLVTVFAGFLPPLEAENLALVAWPTLLLAVLVVMTGETARRVFGTSAAILAVLSLMLWPPIGLGNFAPYRIDHHNVQILLIAVMIFCLIAPGRPLVLGITGGLAAAASFAVGLEMLLTIGIVGLILAVRTVFLSPGDKDQLLGFSFAMFLGSVVLFFGQTPPDAWSIARCDQLSPPYLALSGVAALISIAFARVVVSLPLFRSRVIVALALSAAGGAALLPLLAPCLAGPYASLPPEAEALVLERINEAQSILTSIESGSRMFHRVVLPAVFATLIAGVAFAIRIRQGSAGEAEKRAVGVLLLLGVLGILATFLQMRMMLLVAPAIPLLTGYGLTAMLGTEARTGLRGALRSLAVVVGMIATIFLPLSDVIVRRAIASGPSPSDGFVGCRSGEVLGSLSHLQKGIVLSPIDFGPPILLFTSHDVLAGPYHRSTEALLAGFVPFDGDEETLRAKMERRGADYLLLCRDRSYGGGTSFAHGLAKGGQADWLEEVDGVHPNLLVLTWADTR